MINNMLSPAGMGGHSVYTLAVQPFKEGWRNFKVAVGKKELATQIFIEKVPQDNRTWTQSIKDVGSAAIRFTKHVVVGGLLWIPIVNTITLLFLRCFNQAELIKQQVVKRGILTDFRLSPNFVELAETDQTSAINNLTAYLEAHLEIYMPKETWVSIKNYAFRTYLQNFIDLHKSTNSEEDFLAPKKPLSESLVDNLKFFDPTMDEALAQSTLLALYIKQIVKEVEAQYSAESREDDNAVFNQKLELLFQALTEKISVDFPDLLFIDLKMLGIEETPLLNGEMASLISKEMSARREKQRIETLRAKAESQAQPLHLNFSAHVYQKIVEMLINEDLRLSPDFMETDQTDQTPLISTIREATHDIDMNLHDSQVKEIALRSYLSYFLDAFIFPYVSGQKDPLISRDALMDSLATNIKFFDPNVDMVQAQELLLNLYIAKNFKVINAMHSEEKTRAKNPFIPDNRNAQLAEALRKTLPIDFPNLAMEEETLNQKIAFIKAKVDTEMELEFALNHPQISVRG